MAKNKTTETEYSVIDFINTVEDHIKRADAFELIKIMQNVTGFDPKMWDPGIIGFGNYHYKYDSGHEGDAPLAGFSPRKAAISLYLYLPSENKDELLLKFGKHKAGKGCVYIKKLADIDSDILRKMISASVNELKKLYPSN
ncbi:MULTISPECIES: DUF1801 domain-containing protein [Flavobacterium]|uniref:YdhG-like domain-containing protein n=1 Tax=Flavobacterium salmonis TaxID=2654844 RepID=A0A6V6Z7V0_9FLAO|nr:MULTISPECIES: DUF1801 domain-containing protein [Flavobacterium]OOV19224.1 hypothetical protein BXU10_06025 [Flavobacterium sp. LM4]CAD0007725.1 hypothetical protein FLAT13_04011 [Flavobacterium salmonis]